MSCVNPNMKNFCGFSPKTARGLCVPASLRNANANAEGTKIAKTPMNADTSVKYARTPNPKDTTVSFLEMTKKYDPNDRKMYNICRRKLLVS